MHDDHVASRVRAFILDAFYLAEDDQLTDDTSLIGSGIVDSTGMLDVILFIESEFDIRVGDLETTPENLETIARITEFVAQKRKVVAA